MVAGRIVRALVSLLDRVLGWFPGHEAEHLRTGRTGEESAYFFLRSRGYTMVARNWRTVSRRGEIDLIGWDDGTLCFIEVKHQGSEVGGSGGVCGGSGETGRTANDGASVHAPDGTSGDAVRRGERVSGRWRARVGVEEGCVWVEIGRCVPFRTKSSWRNIVNYRWIYWSSPCQS